MKRIALALLTVLALSASAIAQWQVPLNSVPIGRGPGVIGFTSVAPGVSGRCLVSNGTTWTSGSCGTVTGVTVGTTTIASGTDTRVLFDQAGILGEYAISGTGSVCMTTSCALVTPDLGTPTALVATNATGTAAGLTVGTATTSTNTTNSAITNDTTTNASMFPAWVTANTGNLPLKVSSTKLFFNPSTGLLTSTGFSGSGANLTGVPISTGVSGLGTGVATALAVNVGTAGSFVVNGGALGTPSSGTLTSATGLPISTGLTGAGTGVLTALGVNVGSAGAFVVNGGALGTPSSGTLTSATGLPISTGLTGAGTGVLTALGVNVGSAGAFVTFNGALGTPSSGVATNLTGTAASLTAGTVTTNANLTGPITSSGNATSIASQTGTGTKFVVDTSPTLVTPNIGVATGTSLALTTSSATGLAVGLNGTTNPAFVIDSSTASQAAGLKVTGAATGGTVAIAAIDSGSNTNITLNGKGTGTIGIGSVSTGAVTITPALTLSAALTYGGVTLSNAVSGTGNMALTAGTTFSGTTTVAALTTTGAGLVTISSSNGIRSASIFDINNGVANGIIWGPAQLVGWAPTTAMTSIDALFSRNAAATIRQGSIDAASPVAQTLQAQGSRAGTDSNVGGANYTIQAGLGTGTGTASSLILQSPVLVGSGTGAQTQTTGLTIKSGQAVRSGYIVAALPTGVTGGMAYVTDAVACTFLAAPTGGAATFCPVIYNGSAWVAD